MSGPNIDTFLAQLGSMIAEYHHSDRAGDAGRDRAIAYGNVRYQKWENTGRINIGIIYETPGGSTNQINIEFHGAEGRFAMPQCEGDGQFESTDLDAVLATVRQHVDQIPEKRMEKLRDYVDSWVEEGRTRPAIFEKLNGFLYQELKGGRITHDELNRGCRYVVRAIGDESDAADE